MQKTSRLKREIAKLTENPPEGISCYLKEERTDVLSAFVIGPQGTPYESKAFELLIEVPDRYPFEPPIVKFVTPVYHPNIDNNGRICLDLLNMPPKGSWKPTISLENLLVALRLLLANPNVDDPLMEEIAEEYRFDRSKFEQKARDYCP